MAGVEITLSGLKEVQQALGKYREGAALLSGYTAKAGTNAPYAWRINYGQSKGGDGWRRKAGPARFVERAAAEIAAGANADIQAGITKYQRIGPWMLRRLTRWARRVMRSYTPRGTRPKRHTYRLRRTIKAVVRKGQ